MENNLLILLQLVLAHILTDFVFQPTKWVLHKRDHKAGSAYLYLHSFLAGLFTYIFLLHLNWWPVAVFIAISHYLIDLLKLQFKKDNLRVFIGDQFLHLLMIVIAWLYLTHSFRMVVPAIRELLTSTRFLAIIIGYLLIIFPTGFLVGKATRRWQYELENSPTESSLEAAGRYIGIFERILVLTFIVTGYFSAIGFLIAAKSILRFSDKSETHTRKQTEYVLIGTLMSFAITIFIGLLIRHIAF